MEWKSHVDCVNFVESGLHQKQFFRIIHIGFAEIINLIVILSKEMPFQTVIVHWIAISKVQISQKINLFKLFFYPKSWKFWLEIILQRSLIIISSVILAENAYILCKIMSKLSFCFFPYIFRSFLRKIMYSMKNCGLHRAQVMDALTLLANIWEHQNFILDLS